MTNKSNNDDKFAIRPIESADAKVVAHIIRSVLTEHDFLFEGCSIHDPEVDDMHQAYHFDEKSVYYVLVHRDSGEVVGCGGIGPLKEAPGVCELRKLYFLPHARGSGQGRRMMQLCLQDAKRLGYKECYIETMASLEPAGHLYRRMGFELKCSQLGDTGHTCDTRYIKTL